MEDKLEELRELGIYYKPIPLEFLGNTVCSPSLSEEILGQDLDEDQAFVNWISTVAVGIGGLYFHQAPQCCVITDKKTLYYNLRNVFQSDSELHFFNQVDEFCHKINQAYPNGEEFTAGEPIFITRKFSRDWRLLSYRFSISTKSTSTTSDLLADSNLMRS